MSGRASCCAATLLLSCSFARDSIAYGDTDTKPHASAGGSLLPAAWGLLAAPQRPPLTGFAGRSLHTESSLDTSSSGFILTSFAKEISSRRTRWKSPCEHTPVTHWLRAIPATVSETLEDPERTRRAVEASWPPPTAVQHVCPENAGHCYDVLGEDSQPQRQGAGSARRKRSPHLRRVRRDPSWSSACEPAPAQLGALEA